MIWWFKGLSLRNRDVLGISLSDTSGALTVHQGDVAMSMPNRFLDLVTLCRLHPEAFPQDANNDPARLQFLTNIVIPSFNVTDGGNWGLCTKTDENNKVPVDIAMWKPTREIVDVFTGTGPCWLTWTDPPPDAWNWTAVGDAPPAPGNDTIYDDAQVVGHTVDVFASYAEAKATINDESSVWLGRMVWDVPALGWKASRAKHLAELQSALGLP